MCLEENMNLEDSELEDLDEEQLQALVGGSNGIGEIVGQTIYGGVRPPIIIIDDHIPPDNHKPHPKPIPLPYPGPFPRPHPRPYPHPFPRYLAD
jgi:hypothetical protein